MASLPAPPLPPNLPGAAAPDAQQFDLWAETGARFMELPDVEAALTWLRAWVRGGLRTDSRQVRPGDAFIAWPGAARDPRRHVNDALARGAAACLVEAEGLAQAQAEGGLPLAGEGVGKVAAMQGLKAACGPIADRWYARPSSTLQVLAVTGTNGKSSTAWWTAQALNQLGQGCGLVGTLGVGLPALGEQPAELTPTGFTSPDPVTLQATLASFRGMGLSAAAIEASSHGLAEARLAGTTLAVAQFTNLTQDHLDFHGDMAAYWQAKRRLFDWPGLKAAVVDIDDAHGAALVAQWHEAAPGTALPPERWPTSTVGSTPRARLHLDNVRHASEGLAGTLVERRVDALGWATPEVAARAEFKTRLIGEFNLHNLLQVVGALRALGVSLAQAAAVLAGLTPVPGRMQRVPAAAGRPEVVVDYAHTPDALEQALKALRPLAAARGGALRLVFGCGGNRDASKRPRMGAIAVRLADAVLLTSDNPRNEPPQAILDDIAAGMQAQAAREADRAAAIAQAIAASAAADVVLIAGKGHEDYQEIAGQRRPFSDAAVAAEALARWLPPVPAAAAPRETATPAPTPGQAASPVPAPGQAATPAPAASTQAATSESTRDAAAVADEAPARHLPNPEAQPLGTLAELHRLLPGARLLGERTLMLQRLHTDSRSLRAGDLFVALRGERFDAHDFLAQAKAAGTAAALAERGLLAHGLPGLAVDDALAALQSLAAAWRRRLHGPLIAVAGSNGKTTVTQMTAAILRAWRGPAALATAGNFNNHIGVPLTLLRLRPGHRCAVLELGMNHPGEIAMLAAMAAPTVAVVTNAQREHQEFMASVEAVAEENGQAIAALAEDGIAVFPADESPHTQRWQTLAGARRLLRFSDHPQAEAEVRGQGTWQGRHWAVRLHTPQGDVSTTLQAAGRHNLRNALAAAAAALAAGAPLAAIADGLAAFRPVGGRCETSHLQRQGRGFTLVDDSYNANPDSVRAAIDLLAELPGPHWLLLGDMGEVGDQGPAFHAEVGAHARERGIEAFWAVGRACGEAASAYGEAALRFPDAAACAAAVAGPQGLQRLAHGGSVLVKGSRFMRMEQVAQALRSLADGPRQEG